jgi:hypothetical protein
MELNDVEKRNEVVRVNDDDMMKRRRRMSGKHSPKPNDASGKQSSSGNTRTFKLDGKNESILCNTKWIMEIPCKPWLAKF